MTGGSRKSNWIREFNTEIKKEDSIFVVVLYLTIKVFFFLVRREVRVIIKGMLI